MLTTITRRGPRRAWFAAGMFLILACHTVGDTTLLIDFEQGLEPVYAAGSRQTWHAPGLPDDILRLVPGRFGQGLWLARAAPAMAVAYATPTNLCLKEGTIEFWFRPDWGADFKEPHGPAYLQGEPIVSLFVTDGDPTGLRIKKLQHNILAFYYALNYDYAPAIVRRRGDFWQAGRWNFYTVAWDQDEARIFLDGRLLAVSPAWSIAGRIGGRMALGVREYGSSSHEGAWGTFDDFRISNRKLYVSSFHVPERPLTVEQTPLPEPASNPDSNQLATWRKNRTVFFADFARNLAAWTENGPRPAICNRALRSEPAGVRMTRGAALPGDTLAYDSRQCLQPFYGAMELAAKFCAPVLLPVNLLDCTEITVARAAPLDERRRSGMRLRLDQDGCLEWQYLAEGDTIATLRSAPMPWEADKQYRFGLAWLGSTVSISLDGRVMARRGDTPMPAILPRHLFVCSNSHGEDSLDGWAQSLAIFKCQTEMQK